MGFVLQYSYVFVRIGVAYQKRGLGRCPNPFWINQLLNKVRLQFVVILFHADFGSKEVYFDNSAVFAAFSCDRMPEFLADVFAKIQSHSA